MSRRPAGRLAYKRKSRTAIPLFSSFREERSMLGDCQMALSADQMIPHLDHPWQRDLLLWLQMTILVGGLLWCLALTLTLGIGGWYAVTHPETGRDRTILRVARLPVSLDVRT